MVTWYSMLYYGDGNACDYLCGVLTICPLLQGRFGKSNSESRRCFESRFYFDLGGGHCVDGEGFSSWWATRFDKGRSFIRSPEWVYGHMNIHCVNEGRDPTSTFEQVADVIPGQMLQDSPDLMLSVALVGSSCSG
ncbi:hypothetical protein U1Q18_048010 [Sarracenia purpurea var. burkii]